MTILQPSINRLEKEISNKNYEGACQELLNILRKIDDNFGGIDGIEFDFPEQISYLLEKRTQYFCTRVANAITELFTDPNLIISESGALSFIGFQRWLTLIFASSPYVNADHILRTYNINPETDGDVHLNTDFSSFAKFCILYLSESNININLDALWEINKELCASLCFALLCNHHVLLALVPRLIKERFFYNGFLKSWLNLKI